MPLDTQSIQNAVQPLLPEDAGQIVITPITTGKFNTSFLITGSVEWVIRVAPPRESVFVFYERDMMRQEPGIHALLLAQTSVPVAPIIAYDDSLTRLDRDYIVMERLPGRPISDVSCDYNRVLGQVGDFLAQTHRQTADT